MDAYQINSGGKMVEEVIIGVFVKSSFLDIEFRLVLNLLVVEDSETGSLIMS